MKTTSSSGEWWTKDGSRRWAKRHSISHIPSDSYKIQQQNSSWDSESQKQLSIWDGIERLATLLEKLDLMILVSGGKKKKRLKVRFWKMRPKLNSRSFHKHLIYGTLRCKKYRGEKDNFQYGKSVLIWAGYWRKVGFQKMGVEKLNIMPSSKWREQNVQTQMDEKA